MRVHDLIDLEMRRLIASESAASVAKKVGINRTTTWQYFTFWGEMKVPFSFIIKLEEAGLIDPLSRMQTVEPMGGFNVRN